VTPPPKRLVVGLGPNQIAGVSKHARRGLRVVNQYAMQGGKTVYVPDLPGENALSGGGAFDVMGALNALLEVVPRRGLGGPLVTQWPAADGLLIAAAFTKAQGITRPRVLALLDALTAKMPVNLPVRLDLYLVPPELEAATRTVYALMDDNHRAFVTHLDAHGRLIWRRPPGAPHDIERPVRARRP
jgi:hypothetical protein